ncbi:MAG TPA: 4-carboxymuconolactone decarboxylase [Phenylobacterium sp.]|uniref:4-carboxymuconolactone decarboxylase n=1 Tax=Phenylobacterium sp. TaxID=1871053 RepID=UPI002B45CA4A|nr:4-carboxymuconolactone decarboxylase [Phenylobacterium sp.]HKR25567.1 4-carboxymuconolactone decarboxylase [Allosphingosinicella sp.]HKR89444.1 4-carboxymuconolactone decarboxylase [Phenylobacterium sp.]
MDERERHALGMQTRRSVLGEAHVDRAIANTTPLTAEFQDLITRLAWGEIWTRPAIDHSTRRLLTVAMLIALNREGELKMHLKAALDHGVAPELLKEVILQSAVYCGVPAANSAFALLSEIAGASSSEAS